MRYQFLVDTYRTEIEKVLSVWSMFDDSDLRMRPDPGDPRGRNLIEHMIHQCASENLWFETMLDIRVTHAPVPQNESRIAFIQNYYRHATERHHALALKPDEWWTEVVAFFDARRPRAWVVVRRIAHTAHHRGQQTTLLRVLHHNLHSTYGPTADTGGLMQHNAPIIYPYMNPADLLREESTGRNKAGLPTPGKIPVTERPDSARAPTPQHQEPT